MTETYSRAYTTLIWLGTAKDLDIDDSRASNLIQFLHPISPLAEFERSSQGSGYLSGLHRQQVVIDPCFDYHSLLTASYFERVWVFQEHAMSQRTPWALAGHLLCSYLALYEF